MGENVEKLIELVRKCRFLFDTSDPGYKNVLKKAEAWSEIAKELETTSDAAKKKWKSLRDNYLRYKKSVKGVTGQAKKYHKWQWSQQMQFLDDTLRTHPTESNIKSEEIEDFLDSETSEDQNEHKEPETRALRNASATLTTPTTMLPPPPPRKKKKVETQRDAAHVNKVLHYLKNKPARCEFDGIDHLFLSYADTFRKFRPATQVQMKVELATMFAKMELKELSHLPYDDSSSL